MIYSVIAFQLVFLSSSLVEAQEGGSSPEFSWLELGVIATVFAMSDACMATLQLGQLPLLASWFLLIALLAQGRGRPILAGVMLGAATMKVGTMLPFLLLFHSRRDLPT